MGSVYPLRAKAVVLGCPVPGSPCKPMGCQVRSWLWALPFQAGALGTLSQSLGVPASSTLQGRGRKDTVLAPGCTDQRVCLIADRHWPGFGLSMDPAQGLQGSCSSRGIRQKSLWQRDSSTETSLGLSIEIRGGSMAVWEPGEPSLPFTSCVTLSKSQSRP